MSNDAMRELGQVSRQHVRMVWEISGLDETRLGDEERGLLEAMRQHPEYYDLWSRLDEVTDEELERDGTNPIVHVMFHQTVENQLAADDPPEVAKTLKRLMNQGRTRHEAVHEIGAVLAEEMFGMLKQQRVYDEQSYTKKLRRLGTPRRKRWKRRR